MKCVTSIDGAVLLDLECTCYGVGVILDGEAKSKGNLSRGARYNSALTFLDGKKGYMAVVVSEDRTIDIIVKDQNPAKKAELPQTDC